MIIPYTHSQIFSVFLVFTVYPAARSSTQNNTETNHPPYGRELPLSSGVLSATKPSSAPALSKVHGLQP